MLIMQSSLNNMLETAKTIMNHSYSPYSHYRVGACLKSEGEYLFAGTNLENAAYNLGLCAEAAAIAAMIAAGCREIKEIIIIGEGDKKQHSDLCTPCGACRQRIYEFSTPETLVHLANTSGIQKTLTITELLPHAFGPKHLNY